MDTETKKILDRLKLSLSFVDDNEDLDATDWGMQEGILISYNDAKKIIELIEGSEINDVACPSCGGHSWRDNAIQSKFLKYCKCGNEF